MADTANPENLTAAGAPAPLIRSIGWSILAALAAYLITNALVVGFGFSYVLEIFSGGGIKSAVPIGIYVVLIGA
ncbi:MAG TPA: hypothetical protein ENK41_05525, partial [Rhodobacteraceae bacterium]|nr:hypothetical protein [Paracoccaceae bacterium]